VAASFMSGVSNRPTIARWNGAAWERMPGFVFGAVHDLVDYNGNVARRRRLRLERQALHQCRWRSGPGPSGPRIGDRLVSIR
jgi:hypothetical protein